MANRRTGFNFGNLTKNSTFYFVEHYFLGGLFYCGAQPKSNYNVGLYATPKFEFCISSNRKPEISYKFPSENEVSKKGKVTEPIWDYGYTVAFELLAVTAVNCGREMSYTITTPSLQGSEMLTGKARITLNGRSFS